MSKWGRFSRSRPVRWILGAGAMLRWTLRILLIVLILDLVYLAATWPDWQRLATGPVPKSAFMLEYEREHADTPRSALRWQPVPLSAIPRHMQRAVILAEDSRFYEHSGFDLIAFKEAMDYNMAEGRIVFGGSTISQQTVKNLFLSSARTPWRKWHELVLTWGMERNLGKARILELYLNIAEFGPGVYGVQAAAQTYYGISITQLAPRQAAELAATLPSPLRSNPLTRTAQFERRTARILRLLVRFPGNAADSMAGWPEFLEQAGEAPDSATAPVEECDEEDDCPVTTSSPAPTEPPAAEAPPPVPAPSQS
jgi:monofunctional biosynthetic peptidoglycan transglycosylase